MATNQPGTRGNAAWDEGSKFATFRFRDFSKRKIELSKRPKMKLYLRFLRRPRRSLVLGLQKKALTDELSPVIGRTGIQ